MEKRITSTLAIIHNLSLSLIIGILAFLLSLEVCGQKLPEVVVDQDVVSEETQFIDANRARLMGEYDEAENILNQLLDKYGDKAVYFYELARIYQEIDEPEESLKNISKAIEINSDNEWYLYFKANLTESMKLYDQSVKAYEKLVDLFPSRYYYLENVAFNQLKNNQPKKALSTLEKLENLAGINFETTRQKHLIYDNLGDKKNAIGVLDQFLNIYPDNEQMLEFAAEYAMERNDKNSAIKYLNQLLELDPSNIQARKTLFKIEGSKTLDLAELRLDMESSNLSLDEKLIRLIPILTDSDKNNSSIPLDSLIPIGFTLIDIHGSTDKTNALLGDLYNLSDDFPNAIEYYKKSIEFNDGNYLVWEQLMYALTETVQMKELKFIATEALDLFPNKPMPYAFLGLHYAHEGNTTKSEKLLKDAELRCGTNQDLLNQLREINLLINSIKTQ